MSLILKAFFIKKNKNENSVHILNLKKNNHTLLYT